MKTVAKTLETKTEEEEFYYWGEQGEDGPFHEQKVGSFGILLLFVTILVLSVVSVARRGTHYRRPRHTQRITPLNLHRFE